MFLSALHQIPEEEREEGFSIVPPHSSPLTRLHTDNKSMQVCVGVCVCACVCACVYLSIARNQIWNSFNTRSEDEQRCIIAMATARGEGVAGAQREGEQSYRKIDRQIRSLLQHNKHLPLVSGRTPSLPPPLFPCILTFHLLRHCWKTWTRYSHSHFHSIIDVWSSSSSQTHFTAYCCTVSVSTWS